LNLTYRTFELLGSIVILFAEVPRDIVGKDATMAFQVTFLSRGFKSSLDTFHSNKVVPVGTVTLTLLPLIEGCTTETDSVLPCSSSIIFTCWGPNLAGSTNNTTAALLLSLSA